MALQLSKWFREMNPKMAINSWRLLFRATDDGWDWEAFKPKCVEKGPTLVLVKSASVCAVCRFFLFLTLFWQRNVYGGFANASWRLYGDDNTRYEKAPGSLLA
jgi:hypothetical protein